MKPVSLFIIIAFSSLCAFGQIDDYIHYNYKSRYELMMDSIRHYYQQEDDERAAKYLDQLNLVQATHPEALYIHGIDIYKKRGLQAATDSLKLVCAQASIAVRPDQADYNEVKQHLDKIALR